MRISIDASPLLLRSAGVKNYLYHWIRHLRLKQEGNAVSTFPFLDTVGALTHESSVLTTAQTLPRLAVLLLSNIRGNPALGWMNKNADIFHASNQIHNAIRGVRLTATLHDMTCWLMPELHTPANVTADKRFSNLILKRASGLIAVSENTRQEAIRILDLDPSKVTTIHSGIPDPFFEVTPQMGSVVANRYNLDKPYILAVGTVEPRKNLDTLLDAYLLLPKEIREENDLVLAGPMGWATSSTSQRIRSGLPGVKYLGYIPETELPALTKAATVFAYPSLYEGFGFPVAQAMACGVPVLTSCTSCLPEISGDGALHVDPKSPAEISRALAHLLESKELRATLGRNGRSIAEQRYRWEICAQKSWDFFAQAVG